MKLHDFQTYSAKPLGSNQVRYSSVLIPLIEKEDGLHILFQVRSAKLLHQPGDICFPGGMMENSETPEKTAVREACEELLILPEQIEIIGPSDWYMENNRIIYPFIGILHNYQNSYSRDEVGEVFTVPLSYFQRTPPKKYEIGSKLLFPDNFPFDKIAGGKNYKWRSRTMDVYFWKYEQRVIWGITARLLMGFLELLG